MLANFGIGTLDADGLECGGLGSAGREATKMSQQQTKTVNVLDKVEPVWARIRREAEVVVRQEPELSSFIYASVLHHDRLEQVVVHRIAERLDHPDVSGELIRQAYQNALEDM